MISPWPSIGGELDELYNNRILYQQGYQADNFLELLVPKAGDESKFFGTHVLNIFIAQRAYGWKSCGPTDEWEFNWPPDGFDETLSRFQVAYPRFASYKTLIWVDKYSAQLMQSENPRTEWLSMMDDTDNAIQEFCNSTQGFTYMGILSSQVPSAYFQSYIDAFYGNQPYYK